MEHPIGEMMHSTMNSIKDMVDVNTVVGDPWWRLRVRRSFR